MTEEKEMDLRDYLELIIKRKKLIIGGTLFCLLVGAALAFITPRTYESEAVFQNAYYESEVSGVPVENYLMTPSEVLAIVKSAVILGPVVGRLKAGAVAAVKNIDVENFKDANFFRVSFKGTNANEAKEVIDGFLEQLGAYGQLLMNKKSVYFKKIMARLEPEIATVGALTSKLETQLLLSEVKTADSAVRIITLRDFYNNQKEKLEGLKHRKDELDVSINSFKNFQVLSRPSLIVTGRTKKLIKYSVVAGFAGLFFFMYLAIFLEYWEKSSDKSARK
jgi:capsular polysaccharide biosynthesis protein